MNTYFTSLTWWPTAMVLSIGTNTRGVGEHNNICYITTSFVQEYIERRLGLKTLASISQQVKATEQTIRTWTNICFPWTMSTCLCKTITGHLRQDVFLIEPQVHSSCQILLANKSSLKRILLVNKYSWQIFMDIQLSNAAC